MLTTKGQMWDLDDLDLWPLTATIYSVYIWVQESIYVISEGIPLWSSRGIQGHGQPKNMRSLAMAVITIKA